MKLNGKELYAIVRRQGCVEAGRWEELYDEKRAKYEAAADTLNRMYSVRPLIGDSSLDCTGAYGFPIV